MSQEIARVELHVIGKVQGVWYRASAQAKAQELGLTGWVRNMPDGSVHAVAEGPRPALEAFIEWCRRGPPNARVDEVLPTFHTPTGEFDSFAVGR